MRSARSIVILVAVSILGACSDDTPAGVEADRELADAVDVGQAFRLPVGHRARVGDDGLVIGFRGVLEDSRCPTDVDCVWAGDAAVALTLAVGRAGTRTVTLHTSVEPRAQTVGDLVVRLTGLTPEPHTRRPIDPDSYVASVIVERREDR